MSSSRVVDESVDMLEQSIRIQRDEWEQRNARQLA